MNYSACVHIYSPNFCNNTYFLELNLYFSMKEISSEHKSFIDKIYKDFVSVGENIKQAMYHIHNDSDFECPVVIVSDNITDLGDILIKSGENGNSLNYYATYIDFLVQKNVLPMSDLLTFKDLYHQHKEHCCMLVIFEGNMDFLFVPYL